VEQLWDEGVFASPRAVGFFARSSETVDAPSSDRPRGRGGDPAALPTDQLL